MNKNIKDIINVLKNSKGKEIKLADKERQAGDKVSYMYHLGMAVGIGFSVRELTRAVTTILDREVLDGPK